MPSFEHTRAVDDAGLAALREPRNDIVSERPAGTDRWVCDHGPFTEYQRELTTIPLEEGHYEATERYRYRLAVPVWAPLFFFPIRGALRNRRQEDRPRWWEPPDRLGEREARVLALLAVLQVIDGYLGTVLTQTVTFAADEFGNGNTAQGIVLGVARTGVLLGLVFLVQADRRGRRSVLSIVALTSIVFTILGGLSPGIVWLGASQTIARGLSTSMGLLIGIMAAEEMPRRSRAYAVSWLALTAGLGSGMAVWLLPIADLNEKGWRVIYLAPVLAIPLLLWAVRRLPESKRFVTPPRAAAAGPVTVEAVPVASGVRRRFVLLATAGFLLLLFASPASSFQNDFLKDHRGYSALTITIFTLVTSTPAGIGVAVGGRLAETRGRRPVGIVGLLAGAAATTIGYVATGAPLWIFTTIGVVLGAMVVPVMGVYGPELFATHRRGRANGLVALVGVAGGAVGLLLAGVMSDRWGYGTTFAALSIGPILVAVLVLVAFPETAGMTLEELNPEDDVPNAPPPS